MQMDDGTPVAPNRSALAASASTSHRYVLSQ